MPHQIICPNNHFITNFRIIHSCFYTSTDKQSFLLRLNNRLIEPLFVLFALVLSRKSGVQIISNIFAIFRDSTDLLKINTRPRRRSIAVSKTATLLFIPIYRNTFTLSTPSVNIYQSSYLKIQKIIECLHKL